MTPEIFATKGISIFDNMMAQINFSSFQFVERLVVQRLRYLECKGLIHMPFT